MGGVKVMFGEYIYIIWLLVAVGLLIVESSTVQLVSIWFSLGALAALVVSLIKPEAYVLQIAIFLIVSLILLIFTRKIFVEQLNVGKIKTNVDSLIGKYALVTKKITEFEYGEVKLEGKYWTAKTTDNRLIEEDNKVKVIGIDGVKLIVKK